MSLPPPPADHLVPTNSTSVSQYVSPIALGTSHVELVTMTQPSASPSSLVGTSAAIQNKPRRPSLGKHHWRWIWFIAVFFVFCNFSVIGIPTIFYAESFRRAQAKENAIGLENNALINSSLAFSKWDFCVKAHVESQPGCEQANRQILNSLDVTHAPVSPALVERSSEANNEGVPTHRETKDAGTAPVQWLKKRSLDLLAILLTGRTWGDLIAPKTYQNQNRDPAASNLLKARNINSTEWDIATITSLACALYLDRADSAPYGRLVAMLAVAVNKQRLQYQRPFAYVRPLTDTLVMALPSYTINAVYYEGSHRTTMMFYSALYYNPVWNRYFISFTKAEAAGLPRGFWKRTKWAFVEGIPLLPVSFFLMFDFLPLLEYLHRKSLKPHHQPLIRRPLLSALLFKFQTQRSRRDQALYCCKVALGVWILYNAWSIWLMMGAFFYFVFWDPKVLRRDGNGLLVQILSLVSILTAFLNTTFSE